MAGIELPLIPTEHQYFVTETIPEIAALGRRLPSVADRDGEYYLRQEGLGILVGAYERDMKFWAEDGTPLDFGHELFPDDLDRIEENMLRAIARVPAVGRAGVKRVINGPMIWSPGQCGPVRARAGAQELFLLHGHHPRLLAVGRARATRGRVDDRGRADARHVRLGSRPLRCIGPTRPSPRRGCRTNTATASRSTSPTRSALPDGRLGCVRPTRMQQEHGRRLRAQLRLGASAVVRRRGEPREETNGFTTAELVGAGRARGAHAARARRRHRHLELREVPGERSPAPKAGSNALFANRMPTEVGKSCLTPLIGKRGGIAGDFTVTRVADDYFASSAPAWRNATTSASSTWCRCRKARASSSLTEAMCGFNVAGPKARETLQRLTNQDLTIPAFPFMALAPHHGRRHRSRRAACLLHRRSRLGAALPGARPGRRSTTRCSGRGARAAAGRSARAP